MMTSNCWFLTTFPRSKQDRNTTSITLMVKYLNGLIG